MHLFEQDSSKRLIPTATIKCLYELKNILKMRFLLELKSGKQVNSIS